MIREFSPEKINFQLESGKLNKKDAIDIIISMLEHEIDPKIRLKYIQVIEKIDLSNIALYNTLENHLISDEDMLVRNTAFNKGLKVLKKFLY